jgi:conjugative relaxase-like TrwC/TraI family protein
MAWVTKIIAMEQVDYRLQDNAGCFVSTADAEGASTGCSLPQGDPAGGSASDHRLLAGASTSLVWMGSGSAALGLRPDTPLDDAGKQSARMLMNGAHPSTGARLIPAEVRAHDKAQLPAARLLEAIRARAESLGVEPLALLDGKAKQQRQLASLTRMVHRSGEAYRLQYDTLHRLGRAAGIGLEDVYPPTELADARAHQHDRVNVRLRGWDLVADLPKSLSVLHGLMDDRDERELRALVEQAKNDAFAQLEQWIGYAVAGADGQQVRVATDGLIAWSVEHQSARPVDDRPGDPHLHIHIVIANLARCEDGHWRAVANSGRDLYRHAKAFDALFKARVRALTGERFGMRWAQDETTGAWEVVGVPAELRHLFSRRSAEVNALAGPDACRADKQRVSQRTRHAKHDTARTELRRSWLQRAQDAGIHVAAMVAAAAPGPGLAPDASPAGPRMPAVGELATVVFDPDTGVTASEKAFSRAQLLAALANALPSGIGPGVGRVDALADAVLSLDGHAVPLPHRGSTVMSNTARHTTVDILHAERTIIAQARNRFADGSARLTADQAQSAVAVFEVSAGHALSTEQHRVVQRVLTAGHGIDAVIGVAGAGKTTLMDACRIGWDAVGMTPAGAALSAAAAQNLQTEAGIPSRTLASWLHRVRTGDGLTGIDVLVIDEAAMTDDRSMAELLLEAARTRTKVVAIGDPLQLQAVGPGGGFAEVHRLVDGENLRENRRQRDEAERAALQTWRNGDRDGALHALAEADRIHAADTADDARASILATWTTLRAQWPDPHDQLAALVLLAPRNHDVDLLNEHARALRQAAGELGPDHTYALPSGRRLTLAVGDLVRVRANDYRSRRGEGPDVLNGRRAVITAIDDHHRVRITWRQPSPDGPPTLTSAWLSVHQIVHGHLSLGYAMTVAASQGMTADTSLTYGHGANAFALYAAITRGRNANHLWLPTAALEDPEDRARLGEPRSETEVLQRAVNAFSKLLRHDHPDAMVSHELRPPAEPAIPHWSTRLYGWLTDAALAARIANVKKLEHRIRRDADSFASRPGTIEPAVAPVIAEDARYLRAQLAAHQDGLTHLIDELQLRVRMRQSHPALNAKETSERRATRRAPIDTAAGGAVPTSTLSAGIQSRTPAGRPSYGA